MSLRAKARKYSTNRTHSKMIRNGQYTLIHTSSFRSSSVHVLPVRPWRTDRQFAHLLPLTQILDLSVDKVPQTLQVKTALRARAHEQITPNSGGGDRVVDPELHRAVQADHLLHKVVGARVYGVWPGNTDCKPPSKRLRPYRVRHVITGRPEYRFRCTHAAIR